MNIYRLSNCILNVIASALIVFLVFSCSMSDKDSNGPGTFKGWVVSVPHYQYYSDTTNGISNVKLNFAGKRHSYSTITNSKGKFEILNIDSDTYTLSLVASGYSPIKYPNIKHNGLEWKSFTGQLMLQPSGRITEITAHFDSVSYTSDKLYYTQLIFLYTTKTEDAEMYRTFVGKDKNVSMTNYEYTQFGNFTHMEGYDSPLAFIFVDSLRSHGFKKGSTFYIKTYVSNDEHYGYTDPLTGKKYYTNLDPEGSKVISFTLPK